MRPDPEDPRSSTSPAPTNVPLLIILGTALLLAVSLWRRRIDPFSATTLFLLVCLVALFVDRFLRAIDRGDRPHVESHWGGFGGGLGGWHLSESLAYLCGVLLFTILLGLAHWNASAMATKQPDQRSGDHAVGPDRASPEPVATPGPREEDRQATRERTTSGATSTPTPELTPSPTASASPSSTPTMTETPPRPTPTRRRRTWTPTTTPCGGQAPSATHAPFAPKS